MNVHGWSDTDQTDQQSRISAKEKADLSHGRQGQGQGQSNAARGAVSASGKPEADGPGRVSTEESAGTITSRQLQCSGAAVAHAAVSLPLEAISVPVKNLLSSNGYSIRAASEITSARGKVRPSISALSSVA